MFFWAFFVALTNKPYKQQALIYNLLSTCFSRLMEKLMGKCLSHLYLEAKNYIGYTVNRW